MGGQGLLGLVLGAYVRQSGKSACQQQLEHQGEGAAAGPSGRAVLAANLVAGMSTPFCLIIWPTRIEIVEQRGDVPT